MPTNMAHNISKLYAETFEAITIMIQNLWIYKVDRPSNENIRVLSAEASQYRSFERNETPVATGRYISMIMATQCPYTGGQQQGVGSNAGCSVREKNSFA